MPPGKPVSRPRDVAGTIRNPHPYPSVYSTFGTASPVYSKSDNTGGVYSLIHYQAKPQQQRKDGPLVDVGGDESSTLTLDYSDR